ncbi:MAG TPA: hypothetical protein VGA73_12940 [Candidatus Binatia bacterium]
MKTDYVVPVGQRGIPCGAQRGNLATGAGFISGELDNSLAFGQFKVEGFAAMLTLQRPRPGIHSGAEYSHIGDF